MGLFTRKTKAPTAVSMAEMNARLASAIAAFSRNLREGEQLTESAILGFPQMPDGRGGLVGAPLALAVVTDRVFAFADPVTGEKHVEYPLVQLTGHQGRSDGQFLLQFEATPELVQLCAFKPLRVSDLPPVMTATASLGFVDGLVEQWSAKTGREFVNQLGA